MLTLARAPCYQIYKAVSTIPNHSILPEEIAAAIVAWVPATTDRTNFQNEIGLYDPLTMSLVKIRGDGGIDMFAGTNEGIRIDPGQHRISLISEEIRSIAARIRLQATEDLVATASSILLSADSDIRFETNGTLHLKAGRIVLEAATNVDVI